MPSSDALLGHGVMMLMLAALAAPASAFDPERDTWLLPPPDETRAQPRTAVDPLEFARIRAAGNDQEPEYATPDQLDLIDAVSKGDRERLENLLKNGVNPNGKPDLWGKTALIHAVERSDVEMVRLLLDAGADPDLKAGGYTPLGRAALLGYGRVVRMLLAYGADPDLKGSDGNTPLTAAASMNRTEAIRVLLSVHPDYTLFNLEGRTALSVAAMEGFEDAVRIMLEGGVDAAVLDRNGNTALIMASGKEIEELLVKHGGARR